MPSTIMLTVELCAFWLVGDPLERAVEIPMEEWTACTSDTARLELAFHYGQNDFKPVADRRSVSVCDVIRLPDGRRFKVAGVGFEQVK